MFRVRLIKKHFPDLWKKCKAFVEKLAYVKLKLQLHYVEGKIAEQAEALRQKSVINVCFLTDSPPYWKTDSLFRLMMEHPRFNPAIVVVPHFGYKDAAVRRARVEKTKTYFRQKNYPVLDVWREDDIRRNFKPDIIFALHPYESTSHAFATGVLKELWCYVPYGLRNSENSCSFNTVTQNKYWFNFVESEYVMDIAKRVMLNKGHNAKVTGFPFLDAYFFREQFPAEESSAWKELGGTRKRVIWAPHWDIENGFILQRASFLRFAESMLALAKEYEDKLQFVFKPHPALQSTLYSRADWGQERTDRYYQAWAELPNAQVETGEYTNLFMDSDALIHDCGSFALEYMLTGRPCCYTHEKEEIAGLNQATMDALKAHYWAGDISGVRRFIDQVVLRGEDEKAAERRAYVEKYLAPPHGKSAAQNIINAILGEEE